jgi:hypothetical protein
MNKEELKKLQSELNSISEKRFSKFTDKQLEANDLVSQRNKDPKFIEKVIKSRIGFKMSDSSKKLISEKNKGRKHSLDSSIKKSLATKGIKKTKEHAKKISESLKGKEKSIEHKKKLSESKIGKSNLQTSKRNSELNSKIYKCKYCKRDIGGYANYVRFHNENCKNKN